MLTKVGIARSKYFEKLIIWQGMIIFLHS